MKKVMGWPQSSRVEVVTNASARAPANARPEMMRRFRSYPAVRLPVHFAALLVEERRRLPHDHLFKDHNYMKRSVVIQNEWRKLVCNSPRWYNK